MERLFPGRSQAMFARMLQVAQMQGVTGIQPRNLMNNTRRAIALAEWARDQGRLHPFREAVMRAYWSRGEDIENPEILGRLAEEAGLSAQQAVAAMDSPEYQARVDALRAEGMALGISGIPTVFVGNLRVVGAQPYEVFAEAARRAGASRRT